MRNLIIFLLFLPIVALSHNYQMSGKIKGWESNSVKLYSFYGDKINLLDSTSTNEEGRFSFLFDEKNTKGIYRIGINENYYLDLIFNYEDVIFSTDIKDPFNSLQFFLSKENSFYYQYLKKRNYDQYRLELLQPLISYYPVTDPFFQKILTEFSGIQDSMDEFMNSANEEYPDLFATQIIAIDQRPKLDPTKTIAEQKVFAKQNFFKDKNFSDTSLLYTNIITSNILEYLGLYQEENYTKDQIENEFIKAIDVILPSMQGNSKIYEFVVEYLIGGFDQFGLTKAMTHVASQSVVDENCENTDLKHRIKTLRKLVKGKAAPNIAMDNIELSKIEDKNVLIVFYSSWCPHCNEIMPELKELYQDEKHKLEIISISIDTFKIEYQNYIQKNDFKWLNACNYKGWDTQAVIDYGVYVTPNMFLLDKDKKIISKPTNLIELFEEVERL